LPGPGRKHAAHMTNLGAKSSVSLL